MRGKTIAASTTTALAFALLAGAPSSAYAQTPNQPPPSQPPPSQPPPPQAPASAAGAPTAAVRLHIATEKDKGSAHVYIHRTDGKWVSVCATPCTADVPVNAELRAVYNDNDEEPHDFAVSGDYGPEVDLQVKPPSKGATIAGIVTMGAGGVFVVSGLVLVLAAGTLDDTKTTSSSKDLNKTVADTYRVMGYVCIGLGAAAAVTGLVILLTRSHEPRTQVTTYRPDQAYDKNSTFLSDMASAKPSVPLALPPAFAPLSYGFAF